MMIKNAVSGAKGTRKGVGTVLVFWTEIGGGEIGVYNSLG
jgi:hypothetical protein